MAASDTQFLYTVTASMDDAVKAEYMAWLNDGHIQKIVNDGGARSARVEDYGSADGVSTVQSIYVFESRSAYDEYDAAVAPGLRADGKARFIDNPDKTVTFSRTFEDISVDAADDIVAKEGSYVRTA